MALVVVPTVPFVTIAPVRVYCVSMLSAIYNADVKNGRCVLDIAGIWAKKVVLFFYICDGRRDIE